MAIRRVSVSWWVIPAVVAGLVLAWAATGAPGRLLLAVRVVDALRRPGERSWLDRATRPPGVATVRLAAAGRMFEADVYRPAAGDSPVPILFVPGAVAGGPHDPRVAPFARLLARAGYTVVVPDLPSFQTLRVEPDNVSELAAAHAALCAGPLAPRHRAGILGVSYAGGIALLVALDPAHASRVPYVVTVGAFADLDTAVRFLATGVVVERGRARRVGVAPYGQMVFTRTDETFIQSAADRAVLEAIIARRTDDFAAPIGDLVARLGPEGRAVVELFEGHDPARIAAILSQLPPALRARMAQMSPARRDFSRLRARLYLAHDRDDGTFPVTESERLAALARPHVAVHLVTLSGLHHVEPQPWHHGWRLLTRDLPEGARLVGWWTTLLSERDR
jgi:pimeloyl-ACP methyl ester carboxylesterase